MRQCFFYFIREYGCTTFVYRIGTSRFRWETTCYKETRPDRWRQRSPPVMPIGLISFRWKMLSREISSGILYRPSLCAKLHWPCSRADIAFHFSCQSIFCSFYSPGICKLFKYFINQNAKSCQWNQSEIKNRSLKRLQ